MAPLANASTEVPARRTIQEVIAMLIDGGAEGVFIDRDATGEPHGVTFSLRTTRGSHEFMLPARAEAVRRALLKQGLRPGMTTPQHAADVAWRIVRDWLRAQLALIQSGQAELGEVFLPYMVLTDRAGQRAVVGRVQGQPRAPSEPGGVLMARFAVGVLFGIVVGSTLGAALSLHADDVQAEVQDAAAAAHVDPVRLQGAVNSTGLDPYLYLRGVGELDPPPETLTGQSYTSQSSPRVDCIVHYESRGDAHAVNPRSGAAGLGQFLPSTWKTTPQGRAGLSVFSPEANRAAVSWMLSVGRASEFAVVTSGLC